VTLPLFVAGAGALDGAVPGGSLELAGDEGRHAATVRRVRAGERIDVADGAGRVARCLVAGVGRDRLELSVEAVHDVEPRRPRLVLVQALAKGGRDEQAVETATEFGVDAVVPWSAERSVVQWTGDRGERSRRRWEATALAAAKQSRRATVPVVEQPVTTAGLAARAAGGDRLLVLHEAALEPLTSVELPAAGGIGRPTGAGEADTTVRVGALLVAVGPEGGIAPGELERLTAAGARAVRLGPEVLRASSAGAAALAVLSVRLDRW
jgi:16S rRNA (uracil1498-N3)-methyltransferase